MVDTPKTSSLPPTAAEAVENVRTGAGYLWSIITSPWEAVKGFFGSIFSSTTVFVAAAIGGVLAFAPNVSRRILTAIGGEDLAQKVRGFVDKHGMPGIILASTATGAAVSGGLGGLNDLMDGVMNAVSKNGDKAEGLGTMLSGVITMATVGAVAVGAAHKYAVSEPAGVVTPPTPSTPNAPAGQAKR